MNIQPIILAAGKGTRIGSSVLPKVLLRLKDKPMILHLVSELEKLTFAQKPIIVVGYKYELVQSMLGPEYIYAFQVGQQGTAHAVAAAKGHVSGEHVLVLYGDMPFVKSQSLKKLIDIHASSGSPLTMFTATVPHFESYFLGFMGFGRIIRDKEGNIASIKEFVDASDAERNITEVNPGIYIFNTNWLWQNIDSIARNKHGEYYLTDIISLAKKQDIMINSLAIDPHEVFGINTREHLEVAERILTNLRFGVQIDT